MKTPSQLICTSLICCLVAAKPQLGVLSSPKSSRKKHDSYSILARAIQSRVNEDTSYEVDAIASALRSLSKAQSALKKIDGTAHEMYQRTHKSRTNLAENDDDEEGGGKIGSLKVAGRMSRKAARLGCVADALFAAELCELLNLAPIADVDTANEDTQENNVLSDAEGTLAPWTERKVVYRGTISAKAKKGLNYPTISVMVIFEPGYAGGAGVGHGGVDDLLRFSKDDLIEEKDELLNVTKEEPIPRGRYLVILSDSASTNAAAVDNLSFALSVLDSTPHQVSLKRGSTPGETTSVCEPLYQLAGQVAEAIEPFISGSPQTDASTDSDSESDATKKVNSVETQQPAVHVVGHSLTGGVAALTALILDGSLPPLDRKRSSTDENDSSRKNKPAAPGRSSALCLGPPPCLSSNIRTPFITSVLHGDDIICRTSHATLKHLCERTRSSIKGGVLGRSIGWMTDTVSLTVSGLTSQTKKAKDDRLAVPGKVYLIRPRRIGGGSSSIHEVGNGAAGVRESLRAAVLWQLHDILLSKSMLSHHGLNSYIRSLDRVKLSGLADEPSAEDS